jgi:hypothetical protein
MRATVVGSFSSRSRSDTQSLFIVTDAESLKSVVPFLSVEDDSLNEGIRLMTPGDLQLNFLEGHALLVSVVFIYPNFLRWDQYGADAQLQNGSRLGAWLVAQGWSPPVRRPEG